MKILHVIPSISESDGGPSFAVRQITKELAHLGLNASVATTESRHALAESKPRNPESNEPVFYYLFHRQIDFYKVSLPFAFWAWKNLRRFDLIHIHALFSFTSSWTAFVANRHRIPYIIRPLGVLNRWGVENRRPALKRLSLRLIEGPILRNASAIHYTSSQEKAEAALLNIPFRREVVIPLGIDLAAFDQLPGPDAFFQRFPRAKGRQIILFLSRIDRKKGLDILLRAFALLATGNSPPLLVIAGAGDTGFTTELRILAQDLKITQHILWTGFISGLDKLSLLSAATIFVLSSYSENFGIAAVEALAAGIPSILSSGVAISAEALAADAAMVIPPDADQCSLALACLLRDPARREYLSAKARILAFSMFSAETMGKSLLELYSSILQGLGWSCQGSVRPGGDGGRQ